MTAVRSSTPPPAGDGLARLAHEMREPLASIIHALRCVPPDGTATDKARGIAERQAWRVARIVEDLLDVCTGGWDKLAVRKERVGVAGLVRRAVEAAKPQLAAAGLQLTVTLPPDPPELYADPLRMEQVLANLLANAARFTSPGGRVRVTAEEDAAHVTLRVRDTGRGIPPASLPRVFDPSAQGPGECPRGLGFGLAVVKSLVEAHGGTVTAASDGPGTGAEFAVRLPRGSRPG